MILNGHFHKQCANFRLYFFFLFCKIFGFLRFDCMIPTRDFKWKDVASMNTAMELRRLWHFMHETGRTAAHPA
jgi:hypothetical protein